MEIMWDAPKTNVNNLTDIGFGENDDPVGIGHVTCLFLQKVLVFWYGTHFLAWFHLIYD